MAKFQLSISRMWYLTIYYLLFCFLPFQSWAQSYISATDGRGNRIHLADNRRPALYTQDYGSCMQNPLIDFTRFDGAFYRDNMTVTFTVEGLSSVDDTSLMVHIEVYAYGENRFEMTFDPCSANMYSLCPLNSKAPIFANAIIPINQIEASSIPSIAYSIPDFEGQAIIRIFSTSTQSQLACFAAVLTNGATFSHKSIVRSILGAFAVIALLSSLVTAVYGTDLLSTRKHYAHSLSIFVVFSVFQHIYFTGALSLPWPSVLTGFWSNYAWSAGMIYNEGIQDSIWRLVGRNGRDITMHSAFEEQVDGCFNASNLLPSNIYSPAAAFTAVQSPHVSLMKRQSLNESTEYPWHGSHVLPGLPLPGNYFGFAGTLAWEGIPISNVFMTAFIWFLVTLAGTSILIVLIKICLEGLARFKLMENKLGYFRTNWLRFVGFAVLKTCLIAFFAMSFLTVFQFTIHGSPGVLSVSVVVFAIFLVGISTVSAYALYARLKSGHVKIDTDDIAIQKTSLARLPWLHFYRQSQANGIPKPNTIIRIPWPRIRYATPSDQVLIYDDQDHFTRFGWLYARFRQTRWCSFAIWLVCDFVRAVFLGAAVDHPMIQVFGVLAIEIITVIINIRMKPFESSRLNVVIVYLLGFSKISSVALSAAYHPRFGLSRIKTAVIGIVIIVIQGILSICLLVAIISGAFTTYMAITRNRDVEEFKPRSLRSVREKYLAHVQKAGLDQPVQPKPPSPVAPVPEEPREPSFNVNSVTRLPKIEDEDPMNEPSFSPDRSSIRDRSTSPIPISRSSSSLSNCSTSSLPYGARTIRSTWSSREFDLSDFDFPQLEERPRSSQSSVRETPRSYRHLRNSSISLSRIDSPVMLGYGGILDDVHEETEDISNHQNTSN